MLLENIRVFPRILCLTVRFDLVLTILESLSSYALQRSVSRRLIAAYQREKNAYVRSWIVHSLRWVLGDEVFFATMREVIDEYAGRSLSIAAFSANGSASTFIP